MDIIIRQNRNSADKLSYIEPKEQQPLQLVVQPLRTSDPIGLAKESINQIVLLDPGKFNVLELVENKNDAYDSYSAINSDNRTAAGTSGFIFNSEIITKNRVLFDRVNNFVMMGGEMKNNLKWAFLSVLAVKSMNTGSDVSRLFKKERSFYDASIENILKFQGVRIRNSRYLNFHFNSPAIYPSIRDVILSENRDGSWNDIGFSSWNEVFEHDITKKEIHDGMFDTLPRYHNTLLKRSDLTVFQFMDGNMLANPVSVSKNSYLTVNLYYWSSIDKMAKYFADKKTK